MYKYRMLSQNYILVNLRIFLFKADIICMVIEALVNRSAHTCILIPIKNDGL